ncbi:OLC1v1003596C1 [Oldenlandia corymbosa var. corymbosa]|uniref:OLC1v1003596C1 n=1 Tax=Oldenlandia corymbosa var. corymbosa TaxID=529605 RepID=A0AAV1DCS0_OLDCO|nr:OLC1v1003596C1 [Oldenlandia corymbosa var. corymbosa]
MAEALVRSANVFPSKSFGNTSSDHLHRRRQVGFFLFRKKPSPVTYRSLTLRLAPAQSSSNSFSYSFSGGKWAKRCSNQSRSSSSFSISAQMKTGIIGIGKGQKWWEKGLQPNMKEVLGAQDLVDSLLNAGDKLVVVDFFSPGCGGCKALHPKICQLAGQNPDVLFLQVNYETHKSMCYSLNVHVLPFFRFYRGAHGRLCSFSCTNATIKKFKDALAKYGGDFCSLGPTKGLEEKELLALAANKDLSFTYKPKPELEAMPEPTLVVAPGQEKILSSVHSEHHPLPLPIPLTSDSTGLHSYSSLSRG